MKTGNPPRLAQALLRALLEPRNQDTISGDLIEEYRDRLAQGAGYTALRGWYIRQALSFVTAASLRRALFSSCFGWAVSVGIAELALLCLAPLAGMPIDSALLIFVATLLAVAGVLAIRTVEHRRIVAQASGLWILPFLVAAFAGLRSAPFTPVPGVAAFFVCTAAAALQASARTGKTGAGIAAATVVGAVIALFAGFATALFHLPHPPLAALGFVPAVAAVAGAVSGSFGRRFGGLPPAIYTLTSIYR